LNERIKLPAQEWLGYDSEKGDIHGYTFEQMREFAELIIQECADVAVGLAAPTVALRIKERFGMEKKELDS